MAKPRVRAVRRLSFTLSGAVKDTEVTPSVREEVAATSPPKQSDVQNGIHVPTNRSKDAAGDVHPASLSSQQGAASSQTNEKRSTISDVLPEAQVISNPLGHLHQDQSIPSKYSLETDKQSPLKGASTEQINMYSQCCTQAAILRAQRSFQDGVVTPDQKSSPARARRGVEAATTPTTLVPTNHRNISFLPPHGTDSRAEYKPPLAVDIEEGPIMSTQEMIDAMSPFPMTAAKKPRTKHRASFAPSPINSKKALGNGDSITFSNPRDLDMSTSPEEQAPCTEISKLVRLHNKSPNSPRLPLKTSQANAYITARATTQKTPTLKTHNSAFSSVSHPIATASTISFSIAPNGTLTEVYQPDGQVFENDWDLDAALDDAGSFLGTWDVDKEAKKMASGSAREVV